MKLFSKAELILFFVSVLFFVSGVGVLVAFRDVGYGFALMLTGCFTLLVEIAVAVQRVISFVLAFYRMADVITKLTELLDRIFGTLGKKPQ